MRGARGDECNLWAKGQEPAQLPKGPSRALGHAVWELALNPRLHKPGTQKGRRIWVGEPERESTSTRKVGGTASCPEKGGNSERKNGIWGQLFPKCAPATYSKRSPPGGCFHIPPHPSSPPFLSSRTYSPRKSAVRNPTPNNIPKT